MTYTFLQPQGAGSDPARRAVGYDRAHRCAYCSAPGFAHINTRVNAKLFCDKACLKAYRAMPSVLGAPATFAERRKPSQLLGVVA